MSKEKTSSSILCIGAFDSSGATGLPMDIKTAQSLSCRSAGIVTCLYARNTESVKDRLILPPDFIAKQMATVIDDDSIAAIKIGDVCNVETIEVIGSYLDDLKAAKKKIVLDSVLATYCGTFSMKPEDRAAFKREMTLRADVLVANKEEAELLCGMDVHTVEDLEHAADILRTIGPESVVIRGGVLDQGKVFDIIATEEGEEIIETETPVEKYQARGIGALMSSAIACGLAKGFGIENSLADARAFAFKAIDGALTDRADINIVDPIDAMKKLYELGI